MKGIHFLCAADLHLGRQVNAPSGKAYVIKAWENLIDACLVQGVDALLLAGDVIDGDDLFVEMYGVLKRGIRKLLEHQIQVIAIAGNHDPEVLERVRDSLDLPGFHLLGVGEKWERLTSVFKGQVVHIDGFSFKGPFIEFNPLEKYDLSAPPQGEALIGLLHCDVDVSKSVYAPVRGGDFERMPHQGWILGHIHVPQEVSKHPLVRYVGSLQGLDVSEGGSHGALLLTVNRGRVEMKECPLAPLRWEKITLDLSEMTKETWMGEVLEKIEEELAKVSSPQLECVGVRLKLEGRPSFFREVRQTLSKFQSQDRAGEWIPYFIESIQNETRPPYDLKKIAEGDDLLAALARELLNPQEIDMEGLLSKEPALKHAEKGWPEPSEFRDIYLQKGFALLDELLRQKEEV